MLEADLSLERVIVLECCPDVASWCFLLVALYTHVGTDGNLGMRIRLEAASARVKAASTLSHPVDHQTVTVLHQGVTQVAELGRLTIAFLVQPCFGFGGAAVRFVGALFLLDAALRVRPGPSRSLSSPSLRRKLLIDAHASSSVPSPERWSLDSSPLTFGRATIAARTLAAISPSRSRPRFLEKLE